VQPPETHAATRTPAIGPVLLVGARGMLGRAWQGLLTAHGVPFRAVDLAELDITHAPGVRAAVGAGVAGERFTHAINCAAWTDVDGAESREAEASRVNADAVASLAAACAMNGATLVHYSTDYVFPGVADAPYAIDGPRDPINAYGRTKLAGELAVESSGAEFLLVRTSWLYAPWGKNFVRTIASLATTRPELKVVDDQRGRPTSAEHLARATLSLMAAGAIGPFHLTDGGECSWFEFAREIVRLAGASCTVTPCTSAEFPRPARRPPYSVLDLAPAESLLGPMPHWKTNLADAMTRRLVSD
jgi:dTDP-4-dehydrorhamnose reductase